MELKVGEILTGKVTGITKFGAFVTVAPGKSGLVHISEIANTYVSDVGKFLTDGQEVKVKIIGIDDNGRLNFSIKKAVEASEGAKRENGADAVAERRPAQRTEQRDARPARPQPQERSFEDKLKQFMQDSDSKIAGIRQYEKKPSRRRGGSNNFDW